MGLSYRTEVFPAKSQIECKIRTDFPIVLGEEPVFVGMKVPLPVDWPSSRVHLYLFVKTACIIGKVQEPAELVLRSFRSWLVIVILHTTTLKAELPSMPIVNPAKSLRQGERV